MTELYRRILKLRAAAFTTDECDTLLNLLRVGHMPFQFYKIEADEDLVEALREFLKTYDKYSARLVKLRTSQLITTGECDTLVSLLKHGRLSTQLFQIEKGDEDLAEDMREFLNAYGIDDCCAHIVKLRTSQLITTEECDILLAHLKTGSLPTHVFQNRYLSAHALRGFLFGLGKPNTFLIYLLTLLLWNYRV
eukprot:TRINITY_DN1214_c0_g1_i3.p1 TRINITY_DN1214_c0_g1~~TRINITY_DN1214_c0_g1_i3.p1  ORF type:complete len:193 (-),score=17.08 TRINITY_DN1214_c0_g1_i3:15-593(-)